MSSYRELLISTRGLVRWLICLGIFIILYRFVIIGDISRRVILRFYSERFLGIVVNKGIIFKNS
jgi:hypothetical protein